MREFKNRDESETEEAREDRAHQSLRRKGLEPEKIAEADRDEQSRINYHPHHRGKVLSTIQVAQAERIAQLRKLIHALVNQYLPPWVVRLIVSDNLPEGQRTH